MPNLRFGYKKKHTREEYNQQNKKGTEAMHIETDKKRDHVKHSENFFWDLFLQTGRIDAYLLLKEEEAKKNEENNT